MTDIITPSTPEITASAAPVVVTEAAPVAPVVETPKVEAPVAETTTAPAEPVKTILGSEPEAKVVDIKTGEEKAPEVKTEGEKPKEEIKPADEKKTDEVKKDEGKQSDEPAPLPTYEFELSEDSPLDKDKLTDFTKDLAEFETLTKADHAEMQKFGQKMVDRYVAEVQRLNDEYINAWEQQKNDWKDSFVKDPEIGGNRQTTTINSALEFIRTHGGNETQQQEFRKLMDTTGIGNHPAMIRVLANAMNANREGSPIPGFKPAPENRSKVATRYGNK